MTVSSMNISCMLYTKRKTQPVHGCDRTEMSAVIYRIICIKPLLFK